MTALAQAAVTAKTAQAMGQAILDSAKAFTDSSLVDDACLIILRRL